MTTSPTPSETPTPPAVPNPPVAPRAPKPPRNTVGLIALIAAAVGFLFACIPGALIVGWVLLPIAFILSLVSLFMRGKGKGLGITALILSVVGTLVGFIVFFAVVTTSFDEAFSGGETTITAPADELETEEAGTDEADAEEADDAKPQAEETPEESLAGTREQPLPLGSTITQGDWSVTINSANLNAAEAISAENPFNDAAPEGSVYVLAEVTATYNGSDAAGEMPFTSVEFVTPGGNTLKSYDSSVVIPNSFDSISTLYAGASTTGNMVFTVPADDVATGAFAVMPTVFGDKVFVATK